MGKKQGRLQSSSGPTTAVEHQGHLTILDKELLLHKDNLLTLRETILQVRCRLMGEVDSSPTSITSPTLSINGILGGLGNTLSLSRDLVSECQDLMNDIATL